jgi:hypothetical protein
LEVAVLAFAAISRLTSPGRLICAALLLLLQSCASTIGSAAAWPDKLPDRELFERAWEQDRADSVVQTEEDYLLWVRRFYDGFSTAPGWLELSAQAEERVDPAMLESLRPQLDKLGLRIGREWAKNNGVRRINSRMVVAWHGAMLEAMWQKDMPGFLARLDTDVSAVLAGTLNGDLISSQRYYASEDVDFIN